MQRWVGSLKRLKSCQRSFWMNPKYVLSHIVKNVLAVLYYLSILSLALTSYYILVQPTVSRFALIIAHMGDFCHGLCDIYSNLVLYVN